MKSILEGRPELAREVNKVAEVAGYLWQKGWAERNGGNITIVRVPRNVCAIWHAGRWRTAPSSASAMIAPAM